MTCIQSSSELQYLKPKQRRSTWKQWKKIILAVSIWHSKTRKTYIFLEYLTFYTISKKDNCQTFNCHFPYAKIKHIYNIYTIPLERSGQEDGSPERSDRGFR